MMLRQRLLGGAVASAAAVAAIVVTVPAAQAVPPGSDFDFRVPGVRIFDGNDPNSTILGLGYPGQGFGTDDGPEYGPPYSCDNGQTTTIWVHGTDRTTQVAGWVPFCNLNRL